MPTSDRSWSGLDEFRVVLFADDGDELERMVVSAGTALHCTALASWDEVLRLLAAVETAAVVVRAGDADRALVLLDEATEVAPSVLRLVVIDGDAVKDVVAAQNRGLIEHVVPAPLEPESLRWALRTALVRLSTLQSSKQLVDALLSDRAAARRQFDGLETELEEANRRLIRIAPTDGATGLYNRRHLLDQWRREVARARRYELPLALLLVQPRPAGGLLRDEDLRAVGTLLIQAIRDVDFVAVAGDYRFAVVLPHCGGADASALAVRITDRFEQGADGLRLFVGTAALGEDGSDPTVVFAVAERALGEALAAMP
jgi:GGDEF domain-containing protein